MDFISQFIPGDFPTFMNNNGPNLVAFITAYFEWMEQVGNIENLTNNMFNNHTISGTLDNFLDYFQYEFMNSIPGNIAADRRLVMKHIVDLYQSKGTKRGFALLFRLLFNEDIEVYLPGQDIFKTSDNTWVLPNYIEVSDSPYLPQLVGNTIYSLNGGARALVEDYNVINVNNKVINILTLSSVDGVFSFGDYIMSTDVNYTIAEAAFITGSLSSISIENGGINWNVGDIINLVGNGSRALGRVASVAAENGKVIFNLVDGGFGFTMSPVVEVTGGSGAGATFQVGSLTNQQVYQINNDIINDFYNTTLESQGFIITMSPLTGTLTVGENFTTSSTNTVTVDYALSSGSPNIAPIETLSNTALNISVSVLLTDENLCTVTGTDANLNALAGGMILTGQTSGANVFVNSTMPKVTNYVTGQVYAANSSTITTFAGVSGYIYPSMSVKGSTSGKNGTVTSVQRLTNWYFPATLTSNEDTPIDACLWWENIVIGTIASLTAENPGNFYASNPQISIQEPSIWSLQIDDQNGGFWGGDATVTGTATFANGIATSVQIIDSGYGFESGKIITGQSETNVSAVTGVAVVDGNGVKQGYWKNNKSFLSDKAKLQDSYYYQNYSYEIIAPLALESYNKLVQTLCGPVGYELFGRFGIFDIQNINTSLNYSNMTQS